VSVGISEHEHEHQEIREMNTLNAKAIAAYLVDLVELDDQPWSDDGDKPTVRSFEDAGVLTTNAGLVLRAPDGSKFQVTVIRSR
jgi:hypothetical protein